MADTTVPVLQERRTPWGLAAVLFACSAAVYVALRSGAYCGDMVWQSCVAEGLSAVRFKPDHLFYGPMVRGVYRVWQGIGLPGRAHIALQTVNGLFGGLMVATMFLLVYRISRRRLMAAAAAVLFGLTPYVWEHATDVETYGATKSLQLVAVYLLFSLAEGGETRRRYRLALLLGLFHALATWIHYGHVMLVPAALVATLLPGNDVRLVTRLKVAATYLLTVGVLVWVPYIYIAFWVERLPSAGAFVKWLASPGYGWKPGARMDPVNTPLKILAKSVSWATPLSPPQHLAKRAIKGTFPLSDYVSRFWWRIGAAAVVGLVQVALVAWFVAFFRRIWSRRRAFVIVSLLIIGFYQMFQIYWGGSFMGMAIPAYVAVLVLAFVDAREQRPGSRVAAALVAVVTLSFAVASVAGLVLRYVPEHDESRNLHLQETLFAARQLDPVKDLMFGPGGCKVSEYWAYFAKEHRPYWLIEHAPPTDAADPTAEMLADADQAIRHVLKHGGRVFVHRLFSESEDDMTRPWNEFPKTYGAEKAIRREAVVAHFSRYKHEEAFRFKKWLGHSVYWRITGPPDEEAKAPGTD